jgi:hypothetical protein
MIFQREDAKNNPKGAKRRKSAPGAGRAQEALPYEEAALTRPTMERNEGWSASWSRA